ncbi:MAG: tryptophan--tRNA ligase [Patescibacteria group bacterium]
MEKESKKVILTGDRPTGKLHLGHYAGSLENRVKMQDKYEMFIIIADYQVLTDHLKDTSLVEQSIHDLVLDYLAVGINPSKVGIFVQSRIPAIVELHMYFSMLVNLPRLQRNPTVKEELKKSGSELTYGFLGYPISQAADILAFDADLVPVGEDQVAHVEQTREIARDFNRIFGKTFKVPEALVGRAKRLPGIDGDKMSKSRNNAIYLNDPSAVVKQKVQKAITDPGRIHQFDPGNPDVCVVFQYYRYFLGEGSSQLKQMENECHQGKIGCTACKMRAAEKISEFLKPIQDRRSGFAKDAGLVSRVLKSGTAKANKKTQEVLEKARQAMHYDYPSIF